MNIQEAKEDIVRTVRAYTARDENGSLRIPISRQRPVFLMGPPGIGKTAIMEQIAAECGIGLVAYTMTHHTRQSAIGLPQIVTRSFGGTEYAVTEYTMSEILASVYAQMEQSGLSEGILFLDEINCVSETLMPAMLQFLQYKTFGNHRLPDGWIIVAAGNPVQYNYSVRELDTATMDRVKWLEIAPDLQIWKKYAVNREIHPAVLAFLEWKPEAFYAMQTDMHGRSFVTARGWEDLSQMLLTLEQLGLPVTEALPGEYLHHEEIAREFWIYDQLYQAAAETPYREMAHLAYDQRLCVLQMMLQKVYQLANQWNAERKITESLTYFWQGCRREQKQLPWITICEKQLEQRRRGVQAKKDCGLLSAADACLEQQLEQRIVAELEAYRIRAAKADARGDVTELLGESEDSLMSSMQAICEQLKSLLTEYSDFMHTVFAGKQEEYIFGIGLLEQDAVCEFLKKELPKLLEAWKQATDLEAVRAEIFH